MMLTVHVFVPHSVKQYIYICATCKQYMYICATGKQTRRKLLSLLDVIDFSQVYPAPLALEIFEPDKMERVIQSTERKGHEGIVYSNVRQLHRILNSELNNYQGTVVAAQRPRIIEVYLMVDLLLFSLQVRCLCCPGFDLGWHQYVSSVPLPRD